MKKCKPYVLIAMLIIMMCFVPVLQGCSPIDMRLNNIRNFMLTPQGSEDEAKIKQLIYDNVGEYTFRYPNDGEHRSAVILRDLDSDGESEAIAFYKPKNSLGATLCMMVVSKDQDDNWYKIGEQTFNLAQIDKVSFGDIDADNKEEIVVGLNTPNLSMQQVFVFKCHEDSIEAIIENVDYLDFQFQDFDEDLLYEMMLFSLIPTENDIYTRLMKYNQSQYTFETIGQIKMDSHITEYKNIIFADVFSDQVGVAVDAVLSDGRLATEIIYWDKLNQTLKAPIFSNPQLYESLKRDTIILSEDINEDGIIDLPSDLSRGIKQETTDKYCPIISWQNYNNNDSTMVTISDRIVNYDDGYYITFPAGWGNKIVGKLDSSTQTLTISYKSESEGNITSTGDAILKVKAFSRHIWDNSLENAEEFTEILTTGNIVYAVKIYDNPEYFINEETLKNNFSLL